MGESSLIIILFTDLVGSTQLASRVGDAAADEIRRAHFQDLRDAVASSGGTEVKTIGDAIMVSYSSAADALTGAVEMQRAVDRRNRRTEGPRLEMRVGLSAGDASFENGDWFGAPVVEAARLCAEADAAQILVSDLVRALAGSRVDHRIEPLGVRELKGLAAPISVAMVDWRPDETEGGVPLPGFVDTSPTFSFTGRAREIETLEMAWKSASADAQRQLVLISGDPGIGKTRMVTEFVRTAHAEGGTVLWGRCDEALDVPYQPFAEALRLYVAALDDARLREALGPYADELSPLVPELSARLPGVASAAAGDADDERMRLFDSLADVVAAVSAVEPLVLVLDDIHWADKPSLLMLRHLLRRPESIRLLILATYRDTDLDRSHPLTDVLAELRRLPGVERVDLHGLDLSEVTGFMEGAAGHDLDSSGRELAEAIFRETEGNPFFLGEMIRHLSESGLIVQRDGRWVSDFTLADVGIPEGIRDVVGRRLSRLSDAANEALTIAAVIGPEFDLGIIESVGGPAGDDLFDGLDDAVSAGLVREIRGTFGRYTFGHALVRSTLYEELSTNRRVRMHWKIGEALETKYGDRVVDQLAHHFSEGALAGDPAKAYATCVMAAGRALDELAFESAVAMFDRALSVCELMDPPDLRARFDAELALARTLRDIGDNRARGAAAAAAATANDLADPVRLAEAAVAGAVEAANLGRVDDEYVALMRDALSRLDEGPSALRVELLAGLANELVWGPHTEERVALSEEARRMARELGDPQVFAAALSRVWTYFDGTQPFIGEVRALSAEAFEVAEPGTAPWMSALRLQVMSSAALGDIDAAESLLAEYRAAAASSRLSRLIWQGMADSAALKSLVGDLAGAEAEATEAVVFAERSGVADSGASAFGSTLYNIRRAQGRAAELIPLLEGLVASQPGAPVWRIALAGAAAFARRDDIVREQFTWLTVDGCANIPNDVEFPVTVNGLARIAPQVEPGPEVLEVLYDALLPFAGTMNFTGASIADANDIGLGCVAALQGRHEVADGHFRDAIALAQRARAVPYELHYRYEWARALHARGDLEAASALAEEVVARGDGLDGPDGYVARARDLLAAI